MSDAFTNPAIKTPIAIIEHTGGSDGWNHITTTATLTADQVWNTVSNTASTDYTITLPAASTCRGRQFVFVCIEDLGTGVVTISGAGTFRNFTHRMLATTFAANRITIVSNGYDWDVLVGQRVVTDGSMDATPGFLGETVWNTDDSTLYTCSVSSTSASGAATWVANT
jgi:hypothetical protein